MSTTNTAASSSNNNNNNSNTNNYNINININNNNCGSYLNSGSTNSLNGPVSSSHVNNVVLQTLRSRRANKVVIPLDERVSFTWPFPLTVVGFIFNVWWLKGDARKSFRLHDSIECPSYTKLRRHHRLLGRMCHRALRLQ